jgi:hypothetical protein
VTVKKSIAQQQHLPDARRAPQRILLAQTPDQLLDLQGHGLPACPRLPSPPHAEGPGVPAFHRIRLRNMDEFLPPVQELRGHHPENPKGWTEPAVSLPSARRAIQFGRQLALDRKQLSRRHRPRQQQRPAETESVPEELEEDTQTTASVPQETQEHSHAHQDTRAPRRKEALRSLG